VEDVEVKLSPKVKKKSKEEDVEVKLSPKKKASRGDSPKKRK